MAEPRIKLTAGALPYQDGSGDQVTATVECTDDGLRLRLEMICDIPIQDWPAVCQMVNSLVQSGYALNTDKSREGA